MGSLTQGKPYILVSSPGNNLDFQGQAFYDYIIQVGEPEDLNIFLPQSTNMAIGTIQTITVQILEPGRSAIINDSDGQTLGVVNETAYITCTLIINNPLPRGTWVLSKSELLLTPL